MSLVGQQIGRYRIIEQIGQGGMSVVYKGLDTALDREVAVKVLHPHLAQKPESRKRLEREAKAVARLRHANILEVYDYANENAAEAFIVTELIRGRTLRQFIEVEALQPPEIAAMVVHELASALAHAHEAGVLHRDLKPENVMVRDDGVIKLMDFGIAKILDRDEKMTMTGALVGSPAHMAPEIIEGEEAGAEADVFSLGTMLYLFSTGKLPFTAPNTTATLKKILDCVYDDPRQFAPTVSDELAEIIGTCLQRQPSKRYASAAELRDALATLLNEAGLTRPHEELTTFFLEPRAYRKQLTARLIDTLLTRAEKFVDERKSARALAALNLVLAHDPAHGRATELLGSMQARRQREARSKAWRKAALAIGTAFVLLMSVVKGVEVATRPPDFVYQAPYMPWQLTLGGVSWPSAQPVAPLEPPTEAATAPEKKEPATAPLKAVQPPGPVEIAVVVRPFGYVQVDDGPRSTEALARHLIKLTPGKHRFSVSCDFCEAARPSEATVTRGEEVRLVAPLKPAEVAFRGYPADSKIRVGHEERAGAESETRPFVVTMPAGGSTKMQLLVAYTVSVGGAEVDRGSRWVEPGRKTVIERSPAP